MRAAHPAARAAHLEMAKRYDTLNISLSRPKERLGSGPLKKSTGES